MGAVGGGGDPLAGVPENNLRESCTRLSISLEENGLYKVNIVLDAYLFFPFIECDQLSSIFLIVVCACTHALALLEYKDTHSHTQLLPYTHSHQFTHSFIIS